MSPFEAAFPNDASRCANCGAPAYRHEMADPPKAGMWTQRFDAERFLRMRVESIDLGELMGIFLRDNPTAMREAVLAALHVPVSSSEGT